MPFDTRATSWSLTIWLPPYTETTAKEMIETAVANNPKWSVQGQLEKGKNSDGKFHYQLMVKTPQVRHSALRKAFPACHIEEARNAKALENYVHKDDTRVGEFKAITGNFIKWETLRAKFYEWLSQTEDVAVGLYRHDYERLAKWDEFIGLSIEEGIECDLMGVNPQYRSCIVRYWDNYLRRHVSRDRQTFVDERQTDTPVLSLPLSV